MFDLDSSITNWRRQMLAAGVKDGELLDELESHLRDDVEQHMSEGCDPSKAFAEAARRLAQELTSTVNFKTPTSTTL